MFLNNNINRFQIRLSEFSEIYRYLKTTTGYTSIGKQKSEVVVIVKTFTILLASAVDSSMFMIGNKLIDQINNWYRKVNTVQKNQKLFS